MRCQKCGYTNTPTAKFCKQCGMPQARSAAPAPEPVAMPQPAEQALPQETLVTVASLSATPNTQPCPQCGTARTPGKRFCRQCRFDFTPDDTQAVAPSAPVTSSVTPTVLPIMQVVPTPTTPQAVPQPAMQPGESTYAGPAATHAGDSGKVLLITGGIVVLVALAVAAGLVIHGRHTSPATTPAPEASTPTAVVAPAIPASVALASVPTAPAASNIADASEPAAPASVVSAAPSAPTPPVVNPTPLVPVTPQPEARPVPSVPAATAKPRRVPAPKTDANALNSTIRAAIAGNLGDGEGCFNNKKFDCAISNADAVLRLDPHNAQAQALLHRAKTAQQAALNSMSIQ
jgi:hypothetical protein